MIALSTMQKMVLESSARANVRVIPFLLDKKNIKKTSKFEVDILIDERIYNYGFIIDEKTINTEWLSYTDVLRKNKKWLHTPVTLFTRKSTGA